MRYKLPIRLLLALVALFLSCRATPAQYERILDYHSDITLQDDSSLVVTETITVMAAGHNIRHGIFREFPTDYLDRFHNHYVVDFHMQSATCDSVVEPYRVEPYANGKRIYLGNPNLIVSRGRHTYTLTYVTSRQLGFFKDHDQLFWNVTGNGWTFPIDHASATVRLPSSIPMDKVDISGFTGLQDSRAADLVSTRDDGTFNFTANKPLGQREGLSIVLAWPKGYVTPPTAAQNLEFFFRDNRDALLLAMGFLVMALYYMLSWVSVGRDPAPGVIMPLYEPPASLSPAAMRYLVRMGYDNKTFAAALLDMAARGYLKIKQQAGSYTLYTTGKSATSLTPDEQQIVAELFDGRNELWLHQENHAIIAAAQRAVKKWLKLAEQKVYFVTNFRYCLPPLVLSLGIIAVYFVLHGTFQVIFGTFICFWLTIWTLAVAGAVSGVFKSWRAVSRGSQGSGIGKSLFLTIFTISLLASEALGLFFLVKITSILLAVFLFASALLNMLFIYLMKAPTQAGRRLLDQIEGFKMFLAPVDGDRLNRANPPEQTPEVFEKFLPYALALDVEQAWAEKFSGVLAMAGTAPGDNGAGYTPSFYSSASTGAFAGAAFSSSFTDSFTSAISSSSTAPGSGGDGGGGGGSGGGGGGGGGGGW